MRSLRLGHGLADGQSAILVRNSWGRRLGHRGPCLAHREIPEAAPVRDGHPDGGDRCTFPFRRSLTGVSAWREAVALVDGRPGHHDFNVIIDVADPLARANLADP